MNLVMVISYMFAFAKCILRVFSFLVAFYVLEVLRALNADILLLIEAVGAPVGTVHLRIRRFQTLGDVQSFSGRVFGECRGSEYIWLLGLCF